MTSSTGFTENSHRCNLDRPVWLPGLLLFLSGAPVIHQAIQGAANGDGVNGYLVGRCGKPSWIFMGVSLNGGVYPQIIHFKRDFHYKSSILGVFPLFLETPL